MGGKENRDREVEEKQHLTHSIYRDRNKMQRAVIAAVSTAAIEAPTIATQIIISSYHYEALHAPGLIGQLQAIKETVQVAVAAAFRPLAETFTMPTAPHRSANQWEGLQETDTTIPVIVHEISTAAVQLAVTGVLEQLFARLPAGAVAGAAVARANTIRPLVIERALPLVKATTLREAVIASEELNDLKLNHILFRALSNIFLFYTIIALTTYNWFPFPAEHIDKGCFVPWRSKHLKDSFLIGSGAIAVAILLVRIMWIDIIDGMQCYFGYIIIHSPLYCSVRGAQEVYYAYSRQ